MIILLNQLWFFCAHNFFFPRYPLSLMWHLYCGVFICWFVLGPKPVSSRNGSEHLGSLFYHFSPDKIILCVDLSVFYTIKNVFHFLVNHYGRQMQPKWQSEKQSPNGNRECKNVSLRHLPETCWCAMCWKIGGNSNFMGSKKCCLYREFLNFFGLFIKTSQSFYPHQLVHLLG